MTKKCRLHATINQNKHNNPPNALNVPMSEPPCWKIRNKGDLRLEIWLIVVLSSWRKITCKISRWIDNEKKCHLHATINQNKHNNPPSTSNGPMSEPPCWKITKKGDLRLQIWLIVVLSSWLLFFVMADMVTCNTKLFLFLTLTPHNFAQNS